MPVGALGRTFEADRGMPFSFAILWQHLPIVQPDMCAKSRKRTIDSKLARYIEIEAPVPVMQREGRRTVSETPEARSLKSYLGCHMEIP
jgi:hypothetical protein